MKNLIFLFVFVFLVVNSSAQNNYPVEYVPKSFSIGKLRCYTDSGEIDSNSVINKFMSDYKQNYWSKKKTYNQYYPEEIQIISDTSGAIRYEDTLIYYKLVRKESDLYLHNNDTVIKPFKIINDKLRFKPIYFEVLSESIFNTQTKYIPCIYLIEKNGSIYYPVTTYKYVSKVGDRIINDKASFSDNEFDITFLDKFGQNSIYDTILFQNNAIVYTKKKE